MAFNIIGLVVALIIMGVGIFLRIRTPKEDRTFRRAAVILIALATIVAYYATFHIITG